MNDPSENFNNLYRGHFDSIILLPNIFQISNKKCIIYIKILNHRAGRFIDRDEVYHFQLGTLYLSLNFYFSWLADHPQATAADCENKKKELEKAFQPFAEKLHQK